MLRKAFLLLLGLILIPCISHAEIITYTHTVKQSFGGSQLPDDARVAAIHKAKREALEKAGTYLESLTIVKNSMVEKDEILALAAGVLKAEIVSEKKFLEGNEFGIIVVAKVDVDTSILEERGKKLLQDRKLLKKYEESQKREKELLAKIEKLEEEIRSQASDDKKEELKKQFQYITKGFTAGEWFQKALALVKDSQYTDPNQALDYLDQAIRLDPDYVFYSSRGLAYAQLGQHQRAIEDYNQAIRLDSKKLGVYRSRGDTYAALGQYQRAIEDYTQAIRLAPYFFFYAARGDAYEKLGQIECACNDWRKACELGLCIKLNRGKKKGNCR